MSVVSGEKQPLNHNASKNFFSKHWIVLGLAIALIFFAYASIKLVFVAFETQPGCVPHVKGSANESGRHIAAKSSC